MRAIIGNIVIIIYDTWSFLCRNCEYNLKIGDFAYVSISLSIDIYECMPSFHIIIDNLFLLQAFIDNSLIKIVFPCYFFFCF